MSFLTLEDINTTLYSNQNFWWHEFYTKTIDSDGWGVFDNVKVDFLTISKEKYIDEGSVRQRYGWKYTITVNNSLFTGGFYISSEQYKNVSINGNKITVISDLKSREEKDYIRFKVYMGPLNITPTIMNGYLSRDKVNLNLKTLSQPYRILYYGYEGQKQIDVMLNKGYNEILIDDSGGHYSIGYLFVSLLKTDFQFSCNQELINGKINTVQLGADTDYKPNGDLIGEYTPHITVLYGDETLPVTYDNTLNDYTFDIDLSNREKETDIPLTVYIDNNEVINQTETNIRLKTRFETIDSLTKITTLFANGGTGRLGADLTLTNPLTVTNDVYLIGNDHTINLDGHKIIIPSNKTFKADNTHFRYGENTIQQNTGSKVELTDCTFGYCTGLGSVIDCQVNLDSLDDELDFTTNLTRCIIAESDMAILHGGELTVTDCRVQGIISNPSYPYFLYQTDGNATILQSEFTLINNTQISNDIEFNSCIFICGETAQINGYSHQELQNNNLQQFLETQRNSSIINVTYYYTPINDYITLYSEKGYCHSVSDVDFVFKSNITISRGD